MRRILALLAISTMLLVASGCAGRSAPVTVRQEFSPCPRPAAPSLPELDPAASLCAPGNLEALLEIFDQLRWMIDQQAAVLDCYEAQAKGAK